MNPLAATATPATMIRRLLLALLLLATSLPMRADEPKPVLIAAAADLSFALDELIGVFQKSHPALTVKATYGSSGTLFAQLDNGAPFDLFLSADVKFPRQLIAHHHADEATLFTYAIGHVVIWKPKDAKLDATLGLPALTDPSIRKISIANPKVAPYGAAAEAALKKLGVYDQVSARLVLGENVAQAAQFVQSGAADAGLISLSLALSPKMKDAGHYWEIPAAAYPKLEQAGVICTGGANRDGAGQFREFLTSPAAREVLQRSGFALPDATK